LIVIVRFLWSVPGDGGASDAAVPSRTGGETREEVSSFELRIASIVLQLEGVRSALTS
jgi:hypothetical protein